MTREELRKKRQEIAKNNGYTDYKGKSQNQLVNQQPIEPKVSTWNKVMNTVKTMGTDIGNIGKNFGLGVTSAVKSSGYYIQDMTENKFGDYKRYNQQQSALMKKAEETEKLIKNNGTVNINDVKLPENPNQRQMVSEEETKKALLPQKQESRVLKSIDESIAKDEEKIQQNIDNSSNRVSKKIAELMPSIAQSVTGMGASVVNPALGLGFWQTSAGGGYTREAEKNGYTGNDAMLYGTIMGSMESATEWIGAKLTAGVGKAFFKKGAVEGLKAFGLDVAENFLEEAVMEPIQETVKQAIGKDGDWEDIGSRMLQSGINGALTSIIMGGASAGIGSATNLITKAQSGQQITQKEIADTLKEINKSEEVDIEKILANNFNFTAEDLAVNTDARQRTEQRLENVAEGMSRNEAQQLLINESDLDDTQKEVLSEIATQYNLSDEDVKKAIQNTKDGKYNNLQDTTTQNNEVLNQSQQTIQDKNKMVQNELSTQPSEYTTNLMKSIDNYNNSRQEGQEIFDINNEETRKEIESIQKVAENRGINIIFDENRFDNTDTNAFYEYDKDNNVANIVLNPNSTSKKYVQNLVIHEMTHSFEGSKQYDSLSKAILDYAKSKGEYDTAFNDLMNTYSKVYSGENLNKIVEKEAVANILGEKLGDKEFVDSLVNNQYVERSTIQKIIDFVKNQINRFRGYKDQEAYWNHVKTLFEDAYNKSEVSQEGLKASVERNKLTDTRDSQGRQLSEGQVEYFKDSKVRDENGNLKTVYHGANLWPGEKKFTIFDFDKAGSHGQLLGRGMYFTDNKEGTKQYSNNNEDNVYEVYLNLKNPYGVDKTSGSFSENFLQDFSEDLKEYAQINNYTNLTNYQLLQYTNAITSILKKNGYDGVDWMGDYVAFNSNQIKNIDNTNPTTNDDIRYSVETSKYPTNVKEIKNIREFLRKTIESETNKEWKNRLQDAQSSDYTRISRQSPLQYKREIIQQYLDYKNHLTDEVDNKGRRLTQNQVDFYKNIAPEFRDEEGNIKTYYHGTTADFNEFDTGKIDIANLGKGFYFTDIKEIADSYAQRRTEERGGKPRVIEAYINSVKPFDMANVTREQVVDYLNYDFYDPDNAITQIIRNREEAKTEAENFVKEFEEEQNMGEKRVARAEQRGFIKNNNKYDYSMMIDTSSPTFQKWLRKEGYDSILVPGKDKRTGLEGTAVVVLNPNEIKYTDNKHPTSSNDMRYSQDTTGAWNNFIEKYFKNEGEGTAIKDLKKLPTREYTIQDYEEVINNSANIPEADKTAILKDLEGIELNKQSLNDFKQYVKDLDNNYKEVAQEQEQQRFENKNYKDEGRAELISKKRKEFNKSMDYDDSVVSKLDEIIPRNRNGKRTVAEWKNMAKQLGQRIANLSPEQIEDIAVKSYYDLEPTKAITRYDNQSKTNVGYEQLYANDWVNEVYEGVRENRQFSMETENQENQPTQKELPKAETQLPTRDTSLEEDIEAFRQETRKVTDKTKGRKHLETYATSESVGKEGRKVARELYKSEQYVPISNRETMTKANTKIQTGGVENTYTELTNRFKTNEKMTLQDIATGERLIQIYSAQGDYAKVNELMQDVAILGTELGQQVQALSIIKKASPEGQLQLLNRLVERTNNKQNTDIKITDEQAEKILKSKNKEELDNNVSEVTLELAQQLPITMKDKIRSWRYLSMLGNPRTHIRNIVGNVAMNVLQNTKNKVAGAGEDIASIFNKNLERTKTFKGATQEQKDYAKADSYIMENVLENGGKYSAETLLDQNKRQFDNKILNKIADINSSLLEKEDTVFLRTAYRQALQGYMSANKITPQEMENNPKIANKARQYAIEQAQEATFHQFNALASTLNQIEEKGGVAGTLTSAILPFKKTPLNIAKTGIEYSPINIMRAVGGTISDITQTNKDLQSQLNKGKITQEEYNSEISSIVNNRIDQMAKGLTGTALGVLGYALSKMGVLKATNKDDEDEFEESLGKQEFSIQIGDNTYSLDWLAPTAIPLFIGANIQELFNETGKELNEEGEEKTFYDRVGDTLNTTVTGLTQAFEPMTEMSMLQGLASALSSYEQDSSNKIFDIGASALSSYAGQFVPTALGQVAKTIDPVVRDTSSTKKGFAKKVDQLKRQTTAKIPFASKTLPSKSDVWGEEKTRADNILQRFVETAVLPYNREKVIDDMTSEQLKDVFRETGETGTLPKNPQKYFTVNKQKYNLTSEEYNNAKKIYGKTAKSILNDVTKTQQYKDLDKDIKVKLLKDIYSYAKEEIKVDYSNKKKLDYEPKVNNSANKYKTIQTYKQNKNIEELLKLYNKD